MKRILDLFISLIIILVLLPLIVIIIFIQIFVAHSSVFYSQTRSGLNEKPFKLLKFKTMIDLYDQSNKLLPDSYRVTKFGNLLRFLSLDEIPNFFNVLLGQMSIVGPRPLPVNYSIKMNRSQKKRFILRPGITGLAQISGRNKLDWHEKISLDLVYVDKISLLLDLRIIFKSFFVLIGKNENKDIKNISFNNYEPIFKKNLNT